MVGFSVADGSEKELSPQTWQFSARVQWLPDMTGLLLIAGEGPAVSQLWMVSYPSGKTRRITNDLGGYRAIGLTADGKEVQHHSSDGIS